MASYISIPDNECRFAADMHFRDRGKHGESERRDRFIRFLDDAPGGSTLFLLGDVFDFYFEYRSVVPKRYVDVYNALWRCHVRNVDVHFLGGNHDFWTGDFLTRELRVTVHTDEILVETQGRKAVLAHGDLVMPRDYGYKVLKSIIRNRAVIAVSRWIHPDIMDAIAFGVATGSRRLKTHSQEDRARAVVEHGFQEFYSRGNDVFVMGHVHHPLHEVRGGREFLLLGDWISHFTYGRLIGGNLSLETFTG